MAIVVLVGLIASLVAPRATPIVLLLVILPIVALALMAGHRLDFPSLSPVALALGAFTAYLAMNALWAVNPWLGLSRAVLCGLIVALGTLTATVLPKISSVDATRLSEAVLIGVALAAGYLAVEILGGQPLRRFFISLFPALQPSPKHMMTADGWVTQLNLYTLNRNLGLLNLMLWPTLLLARSHFSMPVARIVGLALLGVAALGMFSSEHESSMLALAVGCLVFVGMTFAASTMRKIVLALWIAATLLVVPFADIAHDAGLHQAGWLPQTARNRIILWSVTADRLQQAPILGIGIDSTKPLDEEAAASAPRRPGDTYAQRTGRHAHNIFMQTWYELGAAGAFLLLVVGITALRALSRLPQPQQPFAYAGFVSAMVIASFTWGMWQPWFMSAFGLWAVLWLISIDAARRRDTQA
jgi:O-antigen ligase